MKYTKEQRIGIGKKIYTRELTAAKAAEIYEVISIQLEII